jgi:hypothetical protein
MAENPDYKPEESAKLSPMERIELARAAAREQREKRDLAELAALEEMLVAHPEYAVVHVPNAAPDLPGHIVIRPPSAPEVAKFRTTIWNDKADVETKSKAGILLAKACKVYPSEERFLALVAAHPMAADAASIEVKKLAEGGARDQSKK